MAEMKPWDLTIENFGGFVPSWFDNAWPSYGNTNQAGGMLNCDIVDLSVLTQGPGIADLTNGSQAGVVTTLITSLMKTVSASSVTYAVGTNIFYKITPTTVDNTAETWPKTIDKDAVTGETATDLIFYQSNIYIFFNHSGSAGDIAKYTISTDTPDYDWGSTLATYGAALASAPHYAIQGADDIMYFTNGASVGYYDGTVLNTTALTFWTGSQTVSLTWNQNRIWVAVNYPNVVGSNFNNSGIYSWNGYATAWESTVPVSGRIGAIYTKNGITFVWWQDRITSNSYNFGYINGLRVKLLERYPGSLPNQAQIGEHNGFLGWISNHTAVTFTAATTDLITSAAHGLLNGEVIQVSNSGGALPTGMAVATDYFIINATANTFNVSTTPAGSALDITGAGSGTNSFLVKGKMYLWGAKDNSTPVKMSQYMQGRYSTLGAFSSTFGAVLLSSTAGTSYSLSTPSGYTVSAKWDSKVFNMSVPGWSTVIDIIQVETEQLASGAKCDFTLYWNQGSSSVALTQIAYSATVVTKHKILSTSTPPIDSFQLRVNWKNGSVSNAAKIRRILLQGRYVADL